MPTRLDQGPASSLVVTREFIDPTQGLATAAWYRHVEPLGIAGIAVMADADPAGNWVRTYFVPGPTLRLAAPTGSDAANIGASVCRTIAELHRAGISHGAVTPDHLIVSPDGVVLIAPTDGATMADDREALAALADWFATQSVASPRLGRTRPEADWHGVSQILRSHREGGLQRAINRLAVTEGPPQSEPTSSAGWHRARIWLTTGLCVLLAPLAALAGLAALDGLAASDPTTASSRHEDTSQLVTVGASTFAVDTSSGDGDEQIEVVPRPCADQPVVVLFDPETRTVWTFAATDADAATDTGNRSGQRLATVPGATGIAFSRTDDDCASVLVVGPAGAVELAL